MKFDKNAFGLIADGNRRWAKSQGLAPFEGHKKGFSVVREIIKPALYDHPDWDTLVVYAFSTENWKRSPLEVANLMSLYQSMAKDWGDELLEKQCRFIHAGRKDRLPKPLVRRLQELESLTQNFTTFRVVLCLDYGSQDEITRAVKMGGDDFVNHLEVPPLDLILRTGGENRLSNFCLWQAAYSEFNFHEKKLPEIEVTDMEKILSDFQARDRRKGK